MCVWCGSGLIVVMVMISSCSVKEAYSNLKKSGFTPDIALLFSLLRYEKELGEW